MIIILSMFDIIVTINNTEKLPMGSRCNVDGHPEDEDWSRSDVEENNII